MIQKCKFQKRNDPPICVISFLELTFLDHFFTQIGGPIWCFVLALCVTITTRWISRCLHRWSGKLWIILLGSGGGGFMGYVIRDPRIIFGGGEGGGLDPRGSVIRGLPTTQHLMLLDMCVCVGGGWFKTIT